jgi:hypothetical protein
MIESSDQIEIERLRELLNIDKKQFNEKVFDWASEFSFQIDGEYLIIDKEKVSDFIDELDRQFDTWAKEEEERDKKI